MMTRIQDSIVIDSRHTHKGISDDAMNKQSTMFRASALYSHF